MNQVCTVSEPIPTPLTLLQVKSIFLCQTVNFDIFALLKYKKYWQFNEKTRNNKHKIFFFNFFFLHSVNHLYNGWRFNPKILTAHSSYFSNNYVFPTVATQMIITCRIGGCDQTRWGRMAPGSPACLGAGRTPPGGRSCPCSSTTAAGAAVSACGTSPCLRGRPPSGSRSSGRTPGGRLQQGGEG